jgi:hypothetical protein
MPDWFRASRLVHVGSITPVHLPGNRRPAKEGAGAALEPAFSAHYAFRTIDGTLGRALGLNL